MSILSEKAMLSNVHVSMWTARKIDRKVTDDINNANEAAADAGRYNKMLLDKDALAPIMKVCGAARTFHYSMTLPWGDDGARLLPAAAYLTYTARLQAIRADFDVAVDEFLSGYQANVEGARKRLGKMFRETDYPSVAEVRRRFSFDTVINPVPSGDDFRVNLGDAQAAAIRADIEERADAQLRAAVRDIYERVKDAVERMVDRLRTYKPAAGKGGKAEGIFRNSLVENIRDLASVLPTLNITSDPVLANIAERMTRELTLHTADDLREDAKLRESVADAADAILADVSEFLA